MSSPLDALYGEQVIFHSKNPRNCRKLVTANRIAEGHNPICGDHQIVYLQVEDDVINDISFVPVGADKVKNCAISKASASMMTGSLKGKSRQEAEALFNEFHGMLTGKFDGETAKNNLGNLIVFAGVRQFPERIKCATLPWHTMRSALEGKDVTTTENLDLGHNIQDVS
ncbi:MAG: SUF system NifU family Fe-S cluster assembly protein [Acidobacteria bacterium]|nr:SUF system NifU family Fe-S cluster assembly protein [Acidobacteriota bacterium]